MTYEQMKEYAQGDRYIVGYNIAIYERASGLEIVNVVEDTYLTVMESELDTMVWQYSDDPRIGADEWKPLKKGVQL